MTKEKSYAVIQIGVNKVYGRGDSPSTAMKMALKTLCDGHSKPGLTIIDSDDILWTDYENVQVQQKQEIVTKYQGKLDSTGRKQWAVVHIARNEFLGIGYSAQEAIKESSHFLLNGYCGCGVSVDYVCHLLDNPKSGYSVINSDDKKWKSFFNIK
jgi:hypothetical protein